MKTEEKWKPAIKRYDYSPGEVDASDQLQLKVLQRASYCRSEA